MRGEDLGLAFRAEACSAALRVRLSLVRAEVRGRPYVKRDIWGRYSRQPSPHGAAIVCRARLGLDLDRALRERQQLLDAKAECDGCDLAFEARGPLRGLVWKASGWPALRDAWISVLRGDQVSESSLLRANIFLRQEPVLVRRGAPKGWARHRGHSAVEARNVPRAERLKGAPKKQAEAIVDARQPGSLPKALRQLSGHEAAWATHGLALPEEPSLGHRKAARPRPVGDGRAPKMRRREVRRHLAPCIGFCGQGWLFFFFLTAPCHGFHVDPV